eukprot:15354141-Alexandrium_andersonii.AAC.1
MPACVKESGASNRIAAITTAVDPNETTARGKYVLSKFGPVSENRAVLVNSYAADGTDLTVARRDSPKQFLLDHCAGHGAGMNPRM